MSERLNPWSNRAVETIRKHPVATAVTLATAGALLAANHLSAEKRWRKGGPTEILTIPHDNQNLTTAGIVFPGMGCSNGEEIANLMNTAVPEKHKHPWSYFMYDNNGITIESIAKQFKQFHEERGLKRAVLYASSMGLATALEVAHLANIPIGILIMDSSPSCHKDGYGSLIGRAANRIPYNGGLMGRYAATYTADTIQRGFGHPFENAKHSIDQTLHGASPYLIRSQADILEKFNFERDIERYRGIIDKNTRAVYLSPPHGEDKTIRVDNAYEGFRRGFQALDLEDNLTRIIVPDSHHVNARESIKALGAWLPKAYEETEHLIYSEEDN
ncbi:MAG TPA: hypothetical protein VLG67_01000 [Candidatus Saccharimonadales bacterium]|nr:hypothetical protein [Candidatus Saccharimonadales bacterium]